MLPNILAGIEIHLLEHLDHFDICWLEIGNVSTVKGEERMLVVTNESTSQPVWHLLHGTLLSQRTQTSANRKENVITTISQGNAMHESQPTIWHSPTYILLFIRPEIEWILHRKMVTLWWSVPWMDWVQWISCFQNWKKIVQDMIFFSRAPAGQFLQNAWNSRYLNSWHQCHNFFSLDNSDSAYPLNESKKLSWMHKPTFS